MDRLSDDCFETISENINAEFLKLKMKPEAREAANKLFHEIHILSKFERVRMYREVKLRPYKPTGFFKFFLKRVNGKRTLHLPVDFSCSRPGINEAKREIYNFAHDSRPLDEWNWTLYYEGKQLPDEKSFFPLQDEINNPNVELAHPDKIIYPDIFTTKLFKYIEEGFVYANDFTIKQDRVICKSWIVDYEVVITRIRELTDLVTYIITIR